MVRAAAERVDPSDTIDHLEELSTECHLMTVPDFLPNASALRETFDENFEDTRTVSPARFCWDYWHIPNQYTLLRTPAPEYFGPEDYRVLEAALLDYGKEKLGCIGITPIWLSYYIDGCKQELHCDNLHGPWAFVLSLTDWEGRRFSGGETMLLSDTVLNYWATFAVDTVIEQKDLMRLVEPHFNQLTVFDPRIPHGVREVRGVQEPTAARIVLHGWFTEPEMFVEGDITYEEAKAGMDACMDTLTEQHMSGLPEATGTLVLRINVEPSGAVAGISFLTDTLVARPWDVNENDEGTARAKIQLAAIDAFNGYEYPSKDAGSVITMPLLFE